MNVLDFKSRKNEAKKISMVTCYDFWSAQVLASSDVDVLLVGDSLAMVMHGHSSTLPATVDMMALHTSAVARGAGKKFIVGDMPFLSFRKSLNENVDAVLKIMQAGAHAVKLEGCEGNEELIRHLVTSGVPVMGHLGLTPQSINMLGGFKVQARGDEAAKLLLAQAKRLEQAGCFSLVLECVPSDVAAVVTKELSIPTIGIGAGVECDGQVLVLQDMLGFNPHFSPKFLKKYAQGFEWMKSALNDFDREVKARTFPTEKESYE